MTPLEFLQKGLKTHIRPSLIHGVGLFALDPIRKGDNPFIKWEGETDYYTLTYDEYSQLTPSVVSYILRSFGNNITDSSRDISFKLTKGCNFLFSEPLALLNTGGKNGSIDCTTGIALKDIEEGSEVLSNYGNFSQIHLI